VESVELLLLLLLGTLFALVGGLGQVLHKGVPDKVGPQDLSPVVTQIAQRTKVEIHLDLWKKRRESDVSLRER
jgi:hypothetical protein